MEFYFLGYTISINKKQFTEFTKILTKEKDIYKYAKIVSKWKIQFNEEYGIYETIPQIKNIRFKWGFSLKTAKDIIDKAIEIKTGTYKNY